MKKNKNDLPEGFVWIKGEEGVYCINKSGDVYNTVTKHFLKGTIVEYKNSFIKKVTIRNKHSSLLDILKRHFDEDEICYEPILAKPDKPEVGCKKIINIPIIKIGKDKSMANGRYWGMNYNG